MTNALQTQFRRIVHEHIAQCTEVRILNKGTLLQVVQAIARIYGRNQVTAGEFVKFEDGTVGLSLHFDSKIVGVLLMGKGKRLPVQEGIFIKEKQTIQIPINIGYWNCLVSAVLDVQGEIPPSEAELIQSPAPGIISRRSVYEPLQTGLIPAIDSIIPIGRRQRELIIGDRQTGKTGVAIDTILNQQGKKLVCVYVDIGQKACRLPEVLTILQERGAMEYSVIVGEPLIIPGGYRSKCLHYNAVFVALAFCYQITCWILRLCGK